MSRKPTQGRNTYPPSGTQMGRQPGTGLGPTGAGALVPDAILSTWRVNDPPSGVFSTEGSIDGDTITATVQAALDYVGALSLARFNPATLYLDSYFYDCFDTTTGDVSVLSVTAGTTTLLVGPETTGENHGFFTAWIDAQWDIPAGTYLALTNVVSSNYLGSGTPSAPLFEIGSGFAQVSVTHCWVASSGAGMLNIGDNSTVVFNDVDIAPNNGGTQPVVRMGNGSSFVWDGGEATSTDRAQVLVQRSSANGTLKLRNVRGAHPESQADSAPMFELLGTMNEFQNCYLERKGQPCIDFPDVGGGSATILNSTLDSTDANYNVDNTGGGAPTLTIAGVGWLSQAQIKNSIVLVQAAVAPVKVP